MKFAIVATAFSLAAALSTEDLPTCASPCLNEVTSGNFSGCNGIDIPCICANDQFINTIACCLSTGCNSNDQQTAINYATDLCGTAGVDIPRQITCNGTSTIGNSSNGNDNDDSGAIGVGPAFVGVLAGVLAAAFALA